MDYEKVLFDLQPIIKAHSIDAIPLEGDFQERYLSVLDQVAVCLRTEHNRAIAGSSGLLKRLLEVLEESLVKCFSNMHLDPFWWKFVSDLIRCVANCLVDNDDNRKILFQEKPVIMDRYVGHILTLKTEGNEELQLRTLAMAKNMCLDNKDYVRRFSKIQSPLLSLLHREDDESLTLIGSELLSDFLEIDQNVSLEDLQFFAEAIWSQSQEVKNQEDEQDEQEEDALDDPALEILTNFTQCLEIVVSKKSSLDFGDLLVSIIQLHLLQTLDELWPKQFENKLIHMRRLMTCVGHISAQESNTNKNERETCYENIHKSNNGYKIGAIFIVLTNSIDSPKDGSQVSKEISFQELIQAASKLTDPMQAQGFLALFKKLLTVSSAMELKSDIIRELSFVLKKTHDQSTFFKDLSPLLDALLNKMFTVLPSSTVHDSLSDPSSPLLGIVRERDSVISCLALDKLLVSSKTALTTITEPLWQTACKFQDQVASGEGNISIFYIFQLAKTFGILLKNLESHQELLQDDLKPWITQLLEFVKPLKEKNDQASQSAVNNGKFVATMLLKLLDQNNGTEQDERLQKLAKELL
ncbi:hypothetical protein ZYGR_0S02260 [Zygosaccharomyces rouxii]|uniref:ZYRO0F07568p n=2 Tax=Zygosaccharomyces rouxii TaxID=4956 RepID=C5DXT1_ZYGRC|nr:uncharacterized protein ZYRO0F07568g [Zygosaccharomyces rouxii]KAH9199351.1 hypothetical protein LQ764DRAFT_129398 [Zygosaccharomyces rouxii]GAV50092.1 hypothetical protein ZYGR_0S02260 [Zygosaccharomyces rouxii]CAR28592.1 ZYRO0F07568p [Zygosaccharomyces rouxii]